MTASAKNRCAKAKASRLDRRRETLQARRLEADVASKKLAKYAEALESNSTLVSRLEADVAITRDRLAVVKKSLKDALKQRDKIRDGRKKIRRHAAKAAQRATNAERKYDQAMLADMLEREKQQDLSRHGGAAPPTSTKPTTPATTTSATRAAAVREAPSSTVSKPTVSKPLAVEPVVRESVESPLDRASGALAPPMPATATPVAATATRAPRRASTTTSRRTSTRSNDQPGRTRG